MDQYILYKYSIHWFGIIVYGDQPVHFSYSFCVLERREYFNYGFKYAFQELSILAYLWIYLTEASDALQLNRRY